MKISFENFFSSMEQVKTVVKFIFKWYPMVKQILQVIEGNVQSELLEKIIYWMNEAEKLGVSGPEKKDFVIKKAEIPEDKTGVVDTLVDITNLFYKK
ncbi:MAG TPA: hypothetical protein PKJ95_04375 [Atribacterota bacterium]|nr:hypothetical protein [Atribacterota bacterium]